MSEWQPIETAPRDGTRIDLWVQWESKKHGVRGKRVADCFWHKKGNHWGCANFTKDGWSQARGETPTHWMPLPQPPQENSK